MARVIDAEEKQWQRESDARTLAEASEIKKDKKRLKGAVTAAKKMATMENSRLNALKSVSRLKTK